MNSNKKVLFADGRWLAQPGQGVYTYFHEIYSRLEQRKIPELEIVYGLLPGHRPDFLPPQARVLTYASDSFLWRQLSLGSEVNRMKPDFAHFQYVLPHGLDKRIHTLVALHDVLFLEHPEFFPTMYRLSRKLFFGSSARRADSLLTISQKSAQDIQRHLGIPTHRISVIPLGAGSRLHAVPPLPVLGLEPCRFLLTVGRHEPRKNYQRLIDAFAESRLFEDRGLPLVIAGWVAPEFKPAANTLPPGVMLLTECSDAQLAWLYGQAKGFVFPSIAEGYGLPLVEALEFGVPSVTSRTHPIDEVRRACLEEFDPYSTEAIRDSLLTLAGVSGPIFPAARAIPKWDDYVDLFVEIILTTPIKGLRH